MSLSDGRYRAAIIGLGQIGNLFDDDPKRTAIWTHAGAYLAMPEVELIAGADPDADRLRRFTAGRGVRAGYTDHRDMLREEPIDVVSICSPTRLHHQMVLDAVLAGVKAIFCEKPLAATLDEAVEMIDTCEAAGVVLAVNHSRRWDPVYVTARRLIEEGAVGQLESIAGCYPGHVYTMGTHLFDVMRWLAGDVEWVCGDAVREQDARREPSVSGFLHFASGAHGHVLCGRDRRNHIFELDVLGSDGRLSIRDDGDRLELCRFDDSPRYSGYRELRRPVAAQVPVTGEPRFVSAVRDILQCLERGGAPACTGRDGMAAVEIAAALAISAAARTQTRVHLGLYRMTGADALHAASR